MILTGYHAHRAYCNGLLIASFMTEALRNTFLAERAAKYPQNKYSAQPEARYHAA